MTRPLPRPDELTSEKPVGEVFVVTLRSPAGSDGINRIRKMLKYAMRAFQLRCIEISRKDAE